MAEPSSVDAAFALGNSHFQAGRFVDAAAAYERALHLESGNPRAHNNLAVALAEQRRFEDALAGYREALRLDPDYAEAHYNLGNALRELARPADALAAYDRACALRPDWPAAHCNRGLALANLGQEALAESAYRRAIALQPDYPLAHNNLGLALELQGHLQEAMAHFDRALELIVWQGNPHHPQDAHRSIPRESLAVLRAAPRTTLVSLQVDELVAESPWLIDLAGGRFPQAGFADTAAILANLDLAISCDTATAHLAGALARPVWIALALMPDFRWLLFREDSPWYPTARLFRQARLDDWEELFVRVAKALSQYATA